MTTEKVSALWLEEGDLVLVNGETFEVVDTVGNDMVDIHLIDDEGYRKILTLHHSTPLNVLMMESPVDV